MLRIHNLGLDPIFRRKQGRYSWDQISFEDAGRTKARRVIFDRRTHYPAE